VTLAFANLHGDINATTTLPTSGNPTAIDAYNDFNEYGLPYAGSVSAVSKLAYGWLGTDQRSTDTLAGITLMGARLYNPGSGRFLSVDAVLGGNENAFTYPNDPINISDITGLLSVWTKAVLKVIKAGLKAVGKLCGRLANPAMGIGCAILIGGSVGLIATYLAHNGHPTTNQLIVGFVSGAGATLFETYGRYFFRILHSTSIGQKVVKLLSRNKTLLKGLQKVEGWATEKGF
jgi:RHS repeat-associated protein